MLFPLFWLREVKVVEEAVEVPAVALAAPLQEQPQLEVSQVREEARSTMKQVQQVLPYPPSSG